MWGFYNNSKRVRCIDCACCSVEEMKCYPNSKDCHKVYDLSGEDLTELAKCDFFIAKK